MTIVLNENEWAEEKIKSNDLGDNTYETLCRVAKYYISNGCSKDYTEQILSRFLVQCDSSIVLVRWNNAIQNAIKHAVKYPPVRIDSIKITRGEMTFIDSIESAQARRLAFALLCTAKYYDAVKETNNHWVSTRDSLVMAMANIKTSMKRQCALFRQLNEIGFLEFAKRVDNISTRICFLDNESDDDEVALEVTDFRNLGYQYLMYKGEPFYRCENCGLVTKIDVKKTSNRLKFCKECALKIAVRQRVNSVMKQRQREKSNKEIAVS
jgi:hypothetical protein